MPPKFQKPFKRGRWRIEQERFNLDPDTKQPPSEYITSVQQTVPSLLKSFGLEEQYWVQTLIKDWAELVGAQVAQHTRPGRIHRKMLFVFVDHSLWLNELSRYGQQKMLENIQAKFGSDKIKSIRLQLDPGER